ncbi:predicted protein [Arabidopsis lyrata subsp. lyrata]|uniref:Predicted protein n=1 Tax=Arabidopsis lyrata subsp. lyrata TaxID=81972 RepID=D7L9C6_ARALL|nr:predicted protein [Arabidopsis lyrata subsp. lyrata]
MELLIRKSTKVDFVGDRKKNSVTKDLQFKKNYRKTRCIRTHAHGILGFDFLAKKNEATVNKCSATN